MHTITIVSQNGRKHDLVDDKKTYLGITMPNYSALSPWHVIICREKKTIAVLAQYSDCKEAEAVVTVAVAAWAGPDQVFTMPPRDESRPIDYSCNMPSAYYMND